MLSRTQGSASRRLLSKYTSRSRLQQQILQKSESSVVDPDSVNLDPASGHGSSISSESGSGYGSRVFTTKNGRKKYSGKLFLYHCNLLIPRPPKTKEKYTAKKILSPCNLLIPRPPLKTSKLQEKPSTLKREHPALQKMKFINFFLFLWVIFALLDPDPIQIRHGSGSTTLSETESVEGAKY
jgi:hypothetical protein